MNSFDSDQDPSDEGIREELRRLSIPATPADVVSRVRSRVRRRRMQNAALAAVPIVLLALGLLVWRPWMTREPLPMAKAKAAEPLQIDELEVLFAAPPVDGFAILARRDHVSMSALQRLEAKP